MSDEAPGLIEKVFVNEKGAKYPIVAASAGDLGGYGIKFYPSVYVIDAEGNVYSVPDDRMPSESAIEELLKSVTFGPKLPEGSQYNALRSMWEKKDYDKIRDYLEKMLGAPNLDAELKQVFETQQQELDKLVQRQVQKVEELAKGPDYYASAEKLEKIAKTWKGFEVSDKAEAQLAAFKDDAEIKKEMAAGEALAKLFKKYDASKLSQAKKLHEALGKFAETKKYEGTYAAEQARKRFSGS